MEIKFITIEKHGNGGRLGNCMHLIASAYGIARKVGATPVFPKWQHSEYFEGKLDETADQLDITHKWCEPHFHYAEFRLEDCVQIKEPTNGIIVQIYGSYLQSERYWEHCREEIIQLFKPKKWYFDLGRSMLIRGQPSIIFKGLLDFVSIHLRFGDYVGNQFYHNLQDTDYYIKAINSFEPKAKNVFFVVVSDDKERAREYIDKIKGETGGIFIMSQTEDEMVDFAIQLMCSHNIIANSSYSHWASILNRNPGKKIIAPKNWFTQSYMDTKDMYSKEIILI